MTPKPQANTQSYSEQMFTNITEELNIKQVILEKNGLLATDYCDNEEAMCSLLFTGNILKDMDTVRSIVKSGLSQRAEAKIKIRQPLQSTTVNLDLLLTQTSAHINKTLTRDLLEEGLSNELIHAINGLRRKTGTQIQHRISLLVIAGAYVERVMDKYRDAIHAETLSKHGNSGTNYPVVLKTYSLDGSPKEYLAIVKIGSI